MIITEPTHFLESDLVVGLSFCTNSDPDQYTIIKVVQAESGLEYMLQDNNGKYYCSFIDCGYLNVYGVQYIDMGWVPTLDGDSNSYVDSSTAKQYICSKPHPFKIKVCK